MPLRKKVTLIPDSTIRRDPHEITDDYQWLFLFVLMMPNTIGAIARAVRRNEYSMAALCISVCVCFFLLQSSLSKYLSLPKNEKSSQKLWLKLNMWFLYTVISFGFVYQFADFLPPQMTVTLYSVETLCSSFLFYVFVIVDLVNIWKDKHRLPENQALVAGDLKYHSLSIWENV